MNCSKCQKPAARAIVVYDANAEIPEPGEEDPRSVRVVHFCAGCWLDVEELLPVV